MLASNQFKVRDDFYTVLFLVLSFIASLFECGNTSAYCSPLIVKSFYTGNNNN